MSSYFTFQYTNMDAIETHTTFFYICKHGYNNEAVSRPIKHFRDKQNRFTKHKLTIGSKSGIPQ